MWYEVKGQSSFFLHVDIHHLLKRSSSPSLNCNGVVLCSFFFFLINGTKKINKWYFDFQGEGLCGGS